MEGGGLSILICLKQRPLGHEPSPFGLTWVEGIMDRMHRDKERKISPQSVFHPATSARSPQHDEFGLIPSFPPVFKPQVHA